MLELKAKIGPKGQFVLPKPIRDELGIKPGDEVSCSLHEGHAHVAKAQSMDAKAAWDRFFSAFPKERLPANHDWDAEFEESYRE